MDMTTGTVVFHERIVVDGKLAAFEGEAMTVATAIARGIDLAKYGYGDEPEKPAAKPRKAAKPDKADE